jgi:HEAT repeat protein
MEQNAESQQDEPDLQLSALMTLLRDSSQDPLGSFAFGRGEFAPRYQALAGLVKLGAAAVLPLCQALKDPNAYTRRFAAEALAKIGDRRAIAPLIIALQESELYVQRYVVGALGAVGDGRAIEPLYRALANREIAQKAAFALHAVLKRAAEAASPNLLQQIASLNDEGVYVAEVPDTDGGYLSWEREERRLDYRPVKQLAQQELERRGETKPAD